jgi:hypothetical protein
MSLPKKTSQLFDTGFASDFLLQDSTLPSSIALKKLLEEQSFQAGTWSPQSRTKFYHCRDDEVIPIATLTEILKEFEDNKNVAEPVIYTTKPDETPFSHITCPGIYDPTLEFISILNN